MVAQRPESTPPTGDPASAAPPAAASHGLLSWLPLAAALVLMPLVAYATTTWVVVPQLRQALGHAPAKDEAAPAKSDGAHEGPTKADGKKVSAPLAKLLVNVAGTQGTRYLLANAVLVGQDADFSARVTEHQNQLVDLASSALSSKTIADLEKPGARNLIRTELMALFNSVLGAEAVREIYFTEFAIQ